MQSEFIFIDIDTQKDLVEHFGARAIPDCPEIRENLMDLMSFAIRNKVPILSPILTLADGDYCVQDSPGWDKVLDAECEVRKVAETSEWPQQDDLQQLLFPHSQLDPFSNNLLLPVVENLAPKNIVVFGVVLEEAVKLAVVKLAADTDAKVWLIKDAVKGFEDDKEVLQELKKLEGVSLMTTRNTLKFLAEVAFKNV